MKRVLLLASLSLGSIGTASAAELKLSGTLSGDIERISAEAVYEATRSPLGFFCSSFGSNGHGPKLKTAHVRAGLENGRYTLDFDLTRGEASFCRYSLSSINIRIEAKHGRTSDLALWPRGNSWTIPLGSVKDLDCALREDSWNTGVSYWCYDRRNAAPWAEPGGSPAFLVELRDQAVELNLRGLGQISHGIAGVRPLRILRAGDGTRISLYGNANGLIQANSPLTVEHNPGGSIPIPDGRYDVDSAEPGYLNISRPGYLVIHDLDRKGASHLLEGGFCTLGAETGFDSAVILKRKGFCFKNREPGPRIERGPAGSGDFTDAEQLEVLPPSLASRLPAHKRAFCSRGEADIARDALHPENLFAFNNPPGIFGGGVCWWHSRLQRSSLYLANFLPERPKPSKDQLRQLIFELMLLDRVVEIPGYRNFAEFSGANRRELTAALSKWQIRDGVSSTAIFKGLSGSYQEEAVKLRSRMDQLYDRMLQKRAIVWQQLYLKGFGTHSWLVVDIQPIRAGTPENPFLTTGYELTVLDSNVSDVPLPVSYWFGDTKIRYYAAPDAGSVVPNTDFDSDLASIEDGLKDYCRL